MSMGYQVTAASRPHQSIIHRDNIATVAFGSLIWDMVFVIPLLGYISYASVRPDPSLEALFG